MIEVVLATLASGTPMGQQEYEVQLEHYLPDVAPDLRVRSVRVRSLRSSLPGEARVPLRAASRVPAALQQQLARWVYGRADLVHRCDLRLPAAGREVVTVHDLAPMRYSDEGELPPGAGSSLRRARAVICPSDFAAAELRDLFGLTDVIVIPNGLAADVWEPVPAASELLAALHVPHRFVLHTGGATARKNLPALAAAWTRLSALFPDVGLVLCGPVDQRRTKLFAGLPRVLLPGRVPRPTLLALMTAAEIVVVPSEYEGFGFPALEAMARGTAVVAADCASLPEVCGAAALLAQPTASGVADALERVLADEQLRTQLEGAGPAQAARYTWLRTARAHADVYLRSL